MRNLGAVASALAISLLSCRGAAEAPTGTLSVRASGLESEASVTRVTVHVVPAGVTAELVSTGPVPWWEQATWTGTLVVPAGTQTVTVRMWAGETLIGEGSASVEVVSGARAEVVVGVLDVTGPPPALDHGPFIRSLTAPKTSLLPGEHVTLTADALDPDGDPLTYRWSQSCSSGTFSATDTAVVEWWSDVEAGCTVTVHVSSGAFTASAAVVLLVELPETTAGTLDVEATFVPQPYVDLVAATGVTGADGYEYTATRTRTSDELCTYCSASTNGSIPKIYFPTEVQQFRLWFENVNPYSPEASVWMDDDCGGRATVDSPEFVYWTAPPTPAVCFITAHVSYRGLSDAFTLAALVDGCTDDAWENDDTAATATPIHLGWDPRPPYVEPPPTSYEWTGRYANDVDWYDVSADAGDVVVTATSAGEPVPVALYASNGWTRLAAGEGSLDASLAAGKYYLQVGPAPVAEGGCSAPYVLRVEKVPAP